MADLTQSLKIRISLTVIWAVVTVLFSAVKWGGSLSIGVLLGDFLFFNFPALLYWLGFWIWGDSYVSGTLKKMLAEEKVGEDSSIGLKIFAGFLTIWVFIAILGWINKLEELPLTSILSLLLIVLAVGKTYYFVFRSKPISPAYRKKALEITLSKKHKIKSLSVSVVAICLAFIVIFVTANEFKWASLLDLFELTVIFFVPLGSLAILFMSKKWIKIYLMPILAAVFLAASITNYAYIAEQNQKRETLQKEFKKRYRW